MCVYVCVHGFLCMLASKYFTFYNAFFINSVKICVQCVFTCVFLNFSKSIYKDYTKEATLQPFRILKCKIFSQERMLHASK